MEALDSLYRRLPFAFWFLTLVFDFFLPLLDRPPLGSGESFLDLRRERDVLAASYSDGINAN